MDTKEHWENVYKAKPGHELSWFEPSADLSLKLVKACHPRPDSPLIDVGSGVSVLIPQLIAEGLQNITVLDISGPALTAARQKIGKTAAHVHWIEANILDQEFQDGSFAIWHDRAVFHFLRDPADRRKYAEKAFHSLRPGGHLIIATFAEDGPLRCSGLEVSRFSAQELQAEFGDQFHLIHTEKSNHTTPAGKTQHFNYLLLQKSG